MVDYPHNLLDYHIPEQYYLIYLYCHGNVWEWTSDWYNVNYYNDLSKNKGVCDNPGGPLRAYNPNNIYIQEKVINGGSFLCNQSYCNSYRISSKMVSSTDSSLEHLGFRTVLIPK